MDDEPSDNKADSALNPTPSSVSTNSSPEKRNLSFCFNFDFDDVNSDVSSDSETADLQIDVSEVGNYEPPNRRKREEEETCSVLDEMEEEIERQLDAKAAKTNLTATNVKNILRHVITNEHVMAMVHKRLYDTEDDVVFEPKLTRAKAKELAAAQVNIPWPITPVKKASSEVQVLIEEELPEDSSDEEYNPEQDKQSDDEREVENSGSSDVECQPSTPASSDHSSNVEKSKSPDIRYDPEGIFKIPEVPHVPTEEESIGQRTRSKLCLSETSLEQIEQSFVPPDITTDMYDWDCELDEDWDNFLKEFTQPLTQEPTAEDDPEADPEYNILEDEESDLLDKEELRADKAVKVTRKELNNLIAELFEFTDTFSKQEQDTSRKKKSPDNSVSSNETSQLNDQSADVPATTEAELPKLLNCDQRKLLAVQMQQHVQLVTQYFLLAYTHPNLRTNANTAKQNLVSLKYLSTGENSAFNALNLPEALKIVSEWEALFADTNFCAEFRTSMADEDTIKNIYNVNKWRYMPRFHPKLEELLVSSKVFMYPQLLPEVPLKIELRTTYTRSPYLKSEENLIALGLEQFLPFIGSRQRKFKSQKNKLNDTARLITEYLTPCRDPQGLVYYINKRRFCKIPNPIKHYFEKGYAPRTIHYIPAECETKAPKDQPIEILPPRWRSYLSNKGQKMDLLKRKHLLNSYNDLLEVAPKSYPSVPENHPLRNPVVNILPVILPNNQNVIEAKKKLEAQSKEQSVDKLAVNKDLPTICTPTKETSPTKLSETKGVTAEEKLDPAINDQGKSETDASNEKTMQKGTSVSRKSSDAQKLPQLRKTTPRLAKTRSAQNMKLMAQALGSKNLSNCNALKGREKSLSKETEKPSLHAKVDNEDEIAELMLASTTIKKDSLSRKKAKEAREVENIKRLLESENPLSEEERESKFAASYLQKLHLNVEPNSPETFRAVIKLYLDYNEKIDALNQTEPISQTTEAVKNETAVNLYRDVCEILRDYPELCTDFLLFLKPRQAAMIDKSVEYMMLKKMSEFVHVAQIYFAKQPSRIAKMMQAITQLASDPHTTLENVHTVIAPIFKGHPLVMDLFLQVLPTAKPPESLFATHMFENLTCPLGPHDKNKVYAEDALELHENVELPGLPSQEDPYGGENCRCNCHTADETNCKNISEHCVSCGTRFLNGRIYLQTSEGLRPAKITFPGADDEQSENIARVSLKPTEKLFSPAPPSKQRRKSSKNENTEDSEKQCPAKGSPSKEEQCEKAVMKRKGVKSPTKTETRKPLKRAANMEETIEKKRIRVSQCRGKREKKTDRKEERKSEEEAKRRSVSEKEEKAEEGKGLQSSEQEKMEREQEKNVEASSSTAAVNANPWTRQEDMVLLQTIREEYSEKSLAAISRTLGNRTVDQVRERCLILLSLLERMA